MVPRGAEYDGLLRPAMIAVLLAANGLLLPVRAWIVFVAAITLGVAWFVRVELRSQLDHLHKHVFFGLIAVVLVACILLSLSWRVRVDQQLKQELRGLAMAVSESKGRLERFCVENRLRPQLGISELSLPSANDVPHVSSVTLAADAQGGFRLRVELKEITVNPLKAWPYVSIVSGSELVFAGACADKRFTWKLAASKGVARPGRILPAHLLGE